MGTRPTGVMEARAQLIAKAALSPTAAPSSQLTRTLQLPAEVQVTFYRVAQAALGNIAKHAARARVQVTLRCTPESATMIITDDGPGFDVAEVARQGRTGLEIMRERAVAVGASLDVDSSREQGTRLALRWPGAVRASN